MSSEQSTERSSADRSERKWAWVIVVSAGLFVCGAVVLVFHIREERASREQPPSSHDSAEKAYQRIFDSYGGQPALDRWRCGILKYEFACEFPGAPSLNGSGIDTFWFPGRVRREVIAGAQGAPARLLFSADGQKFWDRDEDGSIRVQSLQPHRDKYYPDFVRGYHPHSVLCEGRYLTVKGIEVGHDGSRELVIERTEPGREPIEICVDEKTNMIRRTRGVTEMSFSQEMVYSHVEYHEYQTTIGGPVPGRITSTHSGRKVLEMRFVSVEFRDDFPPDVFTLSANQLAR